jgi:ketosteroid isomerase-like protein
MFRRGMTAALLLTLALCFLPACAEKVSPAAQQGTADMLEIERLTKTYAWAVDDEDGELFLSIWSDDVEYVVQMTDLSVSITGIEELEAATDFIFATEKGCFSSLSNLLIEIEGDTAKGRDYFQHTGYRVSLDTGEVEEEPTLFWGRNYWEFRKQDGVWKVTKKEAREHCPTYPECEYGPIYPLPIPE